MFCVFGTNINWKIVEKNFKDFSNPEIFAYTDKPPKISLKYTWKKLDYTIPEEDYETQTTQEGYIKHCLETVESMRKKEEDSKEDDKEKIIYIFENTIYFDFSKKIIFSEELKFSSKKFSDSVRIISDNFVKIKDEVKNIFDLNIETRKKIFSFLYENRITDYCYLISQNLNFSKLFFIISVIHVQIKNRNIYSSSERLEQTLAQIDSIKRKVDNSAIYVLESSTLSFSEMEQLSKNAKVILFDRDSEIYKYAHLCINKNMTEVYLLKLVLPYFQGYSHWCKFGARYVLTDSFDEKEFFSDLPSFRKIQKSHDGKQVYESILYSIPIKYTVIFQRKLLDIISYIKSNNSDVEHALSFCLKDIKIKELSRLNIRGNYALGNNNLA